MAVRVLLAAVAVSVALAGCATGDGGDDQSDQSAQGGTPAPTRAGEQDDLQRYPDVIDATVEQDGDTFTFAVTISSPYDSPERYADGWRVLGPDGTVYGEHPLAHDHANEQPFTRTQTGVRIPAGVPEVAIEGRDTRYGYGGATVTVPLP